ncbi:hypothetical protein E2C01_075207 [Portunus trituberculatus]|uniref:Uncharacterized protein n=1 Tax=Portunus trituberculatus TaxID=210409 RepID=A0A5B7IJG3_PORTR|nr:hypothetical protein [Portunus trituberculatus]
MIDSKYTANSLHTRYLYALLCGSQVVVDTGWGADSSAHNVTETDDPLIQQMNIIRNYIKQARLPSKNGAKLAFSPLPPLLATAVTSSSPSLFV